MTNFENAAEKDGFHFKLWRGERMTMLGFDVDDAEDDFVGFAIEVKSPGSPNFMELRNRLAFDYPADAGVNGDRQYPTSQAPIQKFRWIHFPWQPTDGTYQYRATKMHMPSNGVLRRGTSLLLDIEQAAVTYDKIVDIGFTRNFASSQAYRDQFDNNPDIIPANSKDGLDFQMVDLKNSRGESVYDWLGFEARQLMFQFLNDAVADEAVTIDFMAYDLNMPDFVNLLARMGNRLRAVIDDSSSRDSDTGEPNGHNLPDSCESRSADLLAAAGAAVTRTHFHNLQHNKILIQRRNGVAEKVLCGSTNFSFRGLYIQANNVLVFTSPGVADRFGQMFDQAFNDPKAFRDDAFSKKWHVVSHAGGPTIQLCFSPHRESDLSLNPIAAAADQATSSALYSVAFLSQMKSGPTLAAFERLINRPIFSCGSVDRRGALELIKPDGSRGLVDFRYLGKNAPEPFRSEWSAGKGRNVHHKFLVTDFNLPTAKVFTGSSNFSPSGENKNGDHLIMVQDRKIATAYAIEAIRVFDHLQFRNRMQEADAKKKAGKKPKRMTLRKPVAIDGGKSWFARYYEADSQASRDRLLFSR